MDWGAPSPLDRAPAQELPAEIHETTTDGRMAVEPLPAASPTSGDVLVGAVDGVRRFARPTKHLSGPTVTFREKPDDIVATATALVRWHASAPVCEQCHEATRPTCWGQRRVCVRCGALLFFRTDPAVIVAITDADDRLLLARHATWTAGRMSVIAGFVEVGESLEQACAREAMEEVGLTLTDFRYFGSQPWPLPRSLMAGFTARTLEPEQLRPDGKEIAEARFFTRRELATAIDSGAVTMPGSASIGRALINHWLGQ